MFDSAAITSVSRKFGMPALAEVEVKVELGEQKVTPVIAWWLPPVCDPDEESMDIIADELCEQS